MKKLLIALLLFGCASTRDIPEADIGIFVLVSKTVNTRGNEDFYSYKWFDDVHKVTYMVYSLHNYEIEPGDIMRGLIRK